MRKLGKRAAIFEQFGGYAIAIITFIVIATVCALILGSVRSNAPQTGTACPASYTLNQTGSLPPTWECYLTANASQAKVGTTTTLDANVSSILGNGQNSITNVGSWVSVIIVVAVGAGVLGLIYLYFKRDEQNY